MADNLKLLIESPTFDLQYIIEEKNKDEPRTLFIQGPFLMAEQKNRNGRIYKLTEMTNEVNRYMTEMVKTNRALGELTHPLNVDVNPERACHLIKNIWQEGNVFYGKAKILNTPMGNIVKSLIQEGVQLGVSSRALGKLVPSNDGNIVEDLHLICCDVVHDPSVPTAFVNGILESKEWILGLDGSILPAYENFEKKIATLPKRNRDEYLKNCIIEIINNLR